MTNSNTAAEGAARSADRSTAATSHRAPASLVLGALLGATASCGNGGSGAEVVGLSAPAQVSIVTANESATTALPGGAVAPGAVDPGLPAGSAFYTDAQDVFVYDPSMEEISLINEILCMMSQTDPARMVNRGPYKAQIDVAGCEARGAGGDASDQATGGDGEEFEIWTVDSYRPSNAFAQIVQVWVPNDSEPGSSVPDTTIRVKVRIDEGPSPANPFGSFHMDYAGVETATGDVSSPYFWGTLETLDVGMGSLGFSFFQEFGDMGTPKSPGEFAERIRVSVSMAPDMTTGVGRLHVEERFNVGSGDTQTVDEYQLAFDPTHMLRDKNGAPVCLSRTQFEDHVWRYNLYHASGPDAGELVELDGGFGVRNADGDYGWAGYHGVWMPDGVALADGETLAHSDYASSDQSQYTVRIAPGRLIRNTRRTVLLSELAGETFRLWDFYPTTGETEEFLVELMSGVFWKTATWNDTTEAWEPLAGGSVVISTVSSGFLTLWADSLGGDVSFVHGDPFVTYFEREFVNADDALFASGTVALYGYFDCLRAGIDQAEAEDGDVYLAAQTSVGSPHVYRMDPNDMTLMHDPAGDGSVLDPAGLAVGVAPTAGPNVWGMRSGPLVADTSGFVDAFDIWDAAEFYTYETGHNPWNRSITLLTSQGATMTFDAPLQFTYTHATANDRNDDATYDGKKFLLSYDGAGNLHGIPSEEVDLDGDGNPDRWYPVFALEDGILVGPTGVEYALKAVEVERTLTETPGQCGSLDLAGAAGLPLPDGSDYVTPDIGVEPVVAGPPAVVEGEPVGAP